MKLRMILILLAAPAVLASCAPMANSGCAGWKPITISEATLDYLAAHDVRTLSDMIAHGEFGQELGCWE